MKDYELTVLFHPDLEMNLDPALEKVKKIITTNKGEIVREEEDGKKRLAYKINGQEFAMYYYFDIKLPAEAPMKISNAFNITDEVLRFLIVKTDSHKTKTTVQNQDEVVEDEQEIKSEEKGE